MHLRERKGKSLLFCVRRGQDSNQRRKRKEEIVENRESEEEERRRREKIFKSNQKWFNCWTEDVYFGGNIFKRPAKPV